MYGCAISIASILLNNKDIDLRFHIFCDEIDNETKEKLNELAQQYTSTIRIYIVNSENFKSLPSTKNWSYATYFRFIVADYFYQKIEKVIYIDADIICNNSIEELIDVDLTHHIAAAVAEGKQEWWQKRATKLEVDAIAAKVFKIERLDQVRDIFLFSCFTGLAYIDVKNLTTENITKGIDGDEWIFTHRQKTEAASKIPILPVTAMIIDKYSQTKECLIQNKLLPRRTP